MKGIIRPCVGVFLVLFAILLFAACDDTAAKLDQTPLVFEQVADKTFGSPDFNLEVSGGSGTGEVVFHCTDGEAATVSPSGLVSIVTAGQITVVATKAGDDNYKQETSQPLTLTIGKKKLEKPVALQTELTFDGTNKALDFNGSFDPETMTKQNDAYKSPGAYTCLISLKDTDNYEWANGSTSVCSVPWMISDTLFAGLTVTGGEYIYDGTEKIVTITNVKETDIITYTLAQGKNRTSVKCIDAGEYSIDVQITRDGRTKTVAAKIVIFPAEPTVSTPVLNDILYSADLKLSSIALPRGWEWMNPNVVPQCADVGYEAIFTPDDTKNFSSITRTISLTVKKAPANVTAPLIDNVSFVHGLKLSDIMLPSPWVWENGNANLGVGTCSYNAIYISIDENYCDVTKEVSITVTDNTEETKVPIIDGAIVYSPSKKLSEVVLPDGWMWLLPDTIPQHINNGYQAVFTSTGEVVIVALAVERATPVIPQPFAAKTYSPTRTLEAFILPDGWVWDNPQIVPSAGNHKYAASFIPFDANWNAKNALVYVPINQAPAAVVTPSVADVIYSASLKLSEILLPENWNWQGGDTLLTAGCNLHDAIYLSPDANYQNAIRQISFVVLQATPTVSAPILASREYSPNLKLADILLPEGWKWVNPDTVPQHAESGHEALFTPTDTVNFKPVVVTIVLTITKASPVLETPQIDNIVYVPMLLLSDVKLPDAWAWEDGSVLLCSGSKTYNAIFVSADPNYDNLVRQINFTVRKAIPTISEIEYIGEQLVVGENVDASMFDFLASVSGKFFILNPSVLSLSSIFDWEFVPDDTNFETLSGTISLSAIIPVTITTDEDLFLWSGNTIMGFTELGATLTKFTIPSQLGGESITVIASSAFANCTNLVEVIIPGTFTEIPNNLFSGCVNLTTVHLGNGVELIGQNVFSGCISLTRLVIPKSLKRVESTAFANIPQYSCSIYFEGTLIEWVTHTVYSSFLTVSCEYYYYSLPNASDYSKHWYYADNGEIVTWE